MSLAAKLKKWSQHQLISEAQADSILAFEKNTSRSRMHLGFGGIGILSIILGIASLVAANWDLFSPETKIIGHALLNASVAAAIIKFGDKPTWFREVLISAQAGLVMTFIALIGQILQTQAPLWQPLGFWLLFTTPMLLLYARFQGIVAVWLAVVGVMCASFAGNVLSKEVADIFIAAVPFVLYLAFGSKATQHVLPYWAASVKKVFWVFIVVMASVLQSFWDWDSMASGWRHFPVASIATAGIGCLALFGLNLAQRSQLITAWVDEKPEWDAVLLISFAFAALPILIPHGALGVLAAVMFCLYWLFMGVVGLRLGLDRLWSLAIILIGIRLFVAYVDVMGTLALQGLGFIMTGGLFLLLGWGTKKIIQCKPKWLLVASREGAQP